MSSKQKRFRVMIDAYRNRPLSFFIFTLCTYSITAVVTTFLPVYYRQTAGFSAFQIGVISAVGPVVTIFALLFWGRVADRAKTKNQVLTLLLAMVALCFVIYPLSTSFFYILLCASLYAFFQSFISNLTDAIILEPCKDRGWDYGRVRIAGSVGFGITAFLAGIALTGRIGWQFPIACGFALLGVLFSLPLIKVKGHQSGKSKVSPFVLLKNRNIVLILVLNVLAYTSLGYYYSFYGVHFMSPAMGGSTGLLGFSMLLACIAELPFLFLSKKIVGKLTTPKALLISTALMALRWLFMAVAPSAGFLVAINAMHGVSNIVFHYCTVLYINDHAPPELRATGQGFVGIVTLGGSRIIGGLLGGVMAEALGIGPVFFYAAGLNVVTVVVFAFLFFKRGKRVAA